MSLLFFKQPDKDKNKHIGKDKEKTNTKTNTKKKTNTKAKFCPPALIGSHTTSPLSVKELGLEIRLKPLLTSENF